VLVHLHQCSIDYQNSFLQYYLVRRVGGRLTSKDNFLFQKMTTKAIQAKKKKTIIKYIKKFNFRFQILLKNIG